ncbi:retrovirus-related pol polyprotein from transposon TNT 1-94 [Tanacetum coccineum]
MPVKKLHWKSLYESLYNKTPIYDPLRVIGCLCYAAVTKPNKDKFDNTGVKCVLLGYPQNQKGYKLYDLNTKEIFLSRDVVFDETVFPFKGDTFTHPNITPSLPTFGDIFLDEENDPNIPTQLPNTTNPVSNNERIQTRRSSRQSAKPSWLKDFVTPQSHGANAVSSVSYPLFSSTDFKGIPQSHITFLANGFATSDPTNPVSIKLSATMNSQTPPCDALSRSNTQL